MASDLPLFLLWEKLTLDLLDRTALMPKAMRFTFAQRIDNLAIDVLERIAAARFARGPRKSILLAEIDETIARLRIVVRLCHTRRLLSGGAYELIMAQLEEAGKMIGGWRKGADRGETSTD